MCGILLYFSKKQISHENFSIALDLLDHRGPDNTSLLNINLENNKVLESKQRDHSNFFIGHKRLSIIDLSNNSNQPMYDEIEKKILLYNGEFYNFKQYSNKNTLNSDSLTLFNCLKKNDIKFLENVIGMWALILIDLNNFEIKISRDLYGKKPLYYYHDFDTLILSSEIKSIYSILKTKRKVNPNALAFFLTYKMSPFLSEKETFYKDINNVLPGEIKFFNINTFNFLESKFINKNDSPYDQKLLDNKVKDLFLSDFSKSVDYRLQSDTKIGISLSGGIDSSLISILSSKKNKNINYYTVYNKERNIDDQDDLFFSRLLAKELNIELNEIPISYSYESYLSILEKLSSQIEIPINYAATPFPSYFILNQMKKDGVKVCLDGIGGDEILGFYPANMHLAIANLRKKKYLNFIQYCLSHIKISEDSFFKINKDIAYCLYKGLFKNSLLDHQRNNLIYNKIIKSSELLEYIKLKSNNFKRVKYTNILDRQLFSINEIGIPFYVGISDQTSMMFSIENRSPFLDKNLFKYLQISNHHKFKKGYNKYMLRDVIDSYGHEKIAWRKTKKGFTNFGHRQMNKDKRSRDYILDSNFVKSFIDINYYESNFEKNYYANSGLLAIAALSNQYDLSL